MGQACSATDFDTKAEHELNDSIETQLVTLQQQRRTNIRLLLLGAGESGKSTILKQMKILHKNGFTQQERNNLIPLIFQNTLQSIQSLIQACHDFNLAFDTSQNAAIAHQINRLHSLFPSVELAQAITQLRNDSGIKCAFARQSEFNLLDSAPYFLFHVHRILSVDYSPTDADILRTRQATKGIIETEFLLEGKYLFQIFDVGGQRGERKKWIHCFDDVRAILYIASLNEYDQMLSEDRTRNRLVESLSLFEGICSLPWFSSTSIILFLNKNDLFLEKVERVDLGIYFPHYHHGFNYEAALSFIKQLFFARNKNVNKMIYAHVTDATDTQQIAFVWKATKHIVMEANLARAGIM